MDSDVQLYFCLYVVKEIREISFYHEPHFQGDPAESIALFLATTRKSKSISARLMRAQCITHVKRKKYFAEMIYAGVTSETSANRRKSKYTYWLLHGNSSLLKEDVNRNAQAGDRSMLFAHFDREH